jgi:hypothetical protein
MFERLKAAKNFRSGTMTLRQVHFAVTDLELHARFTPGQGESVFDRDRKVRGRALGVGGRRGRRGRRAPARGRPLALQPKAPLLSLFHAPSEPHPAPPRLRPRPR